MKPCLIPNSSLNFSQLQFQFPCRFIFLFFSLNYVHVNIQIGRRKIKDRKRDRDRETNFKCNCCCNFVLTIRTKSYRLCGIGLCMLMNGIKLIYIYICFHHLAKCTNLLTVIIFVSSSTFRFNSFFFSSLVFRLYDFILVTFHHSVCTCVNSTYGNNNEMQPFCVLFSAIVFCTMYIDICDIVKGHINTTQNTFKHTFKGNLGNGRSVFVCFEPTPRILCVVTIITKCS